MKMFYRYCAELMQNKKANIFLKFMVSSKARLRVGQIQSIHRVRAKFDDQPKSILLKLHGASMQSSALFPSVVLSIPWKECFFSMKER